MVVTLRAAMDTAHLWCDDTVYMIDATDVLARAPCDRDRRDMQHQHQYC